MRYQELTESTLDWDGYWITPAGETIHLDPQEGDPVHHLYVLDDYFPELDDMFDNECDGDSDLYGEMAINYALDKGWLRIRTWKPTAEFNVQLTVKPSRRALAALSSLLETTSFKTFVFDSDEGREGGRDRGEIYDSPKALMRAIMQTYYNA